MTPAVAQARRAGIAFTLHRYDSDPRHPSFGLEAAERLGEPPERVFKTLIAELGADRGSELVVAVLPVDARLNLKKLARAAGARKAAMAPVEQAERATGYVHGGISPLGQKKVLRCFIDDSARRQSRLFVSAGRRGLEIELSPVDLQRMTEGVWSELSDKE